MLKWGGGGGGGGGGILFRSFSYNNEMKLRVFFRKICNLIPPTIRDKKSGRLALSKIYNYGIIVLW